MRTWLVLPAVVLGLVCPVDPAFADGLVVEGPPPPEGPLGWKTLANGLDCTNYSNRIRNEAEYANYDLAIRPLGCPALESFDTGPECTDPIAPTIVCLDPGGLVGGSYAILLIEDSTLDVRGGTVAPGTWVYARGNASLEMTSGSADEVVLVDQSTARIRTDQPLGQVDIGGTAHLDLVAPLVPTLYAASQAFGVFSSTVYFVEVHGAAHITMQGGEVTGGADVSDQGVFAVQAGRLSGGILLDSRDASFVLAGGTVAGDLDAGRGDYTLSGGTIEGDLIVYPGSTVLSGTEVAGSIVLDSPEGPRIVGTGFALDGTPLAFGVQHVAAGRLTGALANGTPLAADVSADPDCSNCDGRIELVDATTVPEPAMGALAAAALVAVGALRRKRLPFRRRPASAAVSPAATSRPVPGSGTIRRVAVVATDTSTFRRSPDSRVPESCPWMSS